MQYSECISRLKAEGAFQVLAECRKLESQGKSIIHLEIGEPDFDTPKNIADAGIEAIRNGITHYTAAAGTLEARAVAAEHLNKTRGISVVPEDMILMPGVKPLIFAAIVALINRGDEVICPNPGYPTYESVVEFVGATPVPMASCKRYRLSCSVHQRKHPAGGGTRQSFSPHPLAGPEAPRSWLPG